MCAFSSKKGPWVYILFAFYAQHTYDNLNVYNLDVYVCKDLQIIVRSLVSI